LEPMTEKISQRNEKRIDRQSRKFYETLVKKSYPVPSLFGLFIFRWGRTSMREMLDESFRDYTFYRQSGWFENDYYYPVRLGPLKKAVGKMVDWTVSRGAKKDKAKKVEDQKRRC